MRIQWILYPELMATIAADATGCMLYLLIIHSRLNKWKGIGAIISIGLIELSMLFMAQEIPDFWWIPGTIATLCRMYLFICACNDSELQTWGLYFVRGFLLAELAAFVTWQTYTYVSGYWELTPFFCFLSFAIVLFYYCSAAAIEVWQFPKERTWKTRILELIPVLGIGITVMVSAYSYFIILEQNVILNSQLPTFRVSMDLAGLLILYVYSLIYNEHAARKEVTAMEAIIQKQYQQYQMTQDSVNLINQKYHDFKHQIELLRRTDKSEIRDAYLDELQEDIENYEAFNKTGCAVLDTILTSYNLRCIKEGICFTSVADGKLLAFMDTMDICSVFGNILENAVEYEQMIEQKKRMIHLSVSAQKGFLLILAENYYEGEAGQAETQPETTKKNKSLHGFGLKSMQKMAEKYNGKMTVGIYENWFEVRILIPLNA